MTTIELKSSIHQLIDDIDNDNLLSNVYSLLSNVKETKGSLWNKLNLEEQDELIKIEQDATNEANLISNSVIRNKHQKWL